jgi:hypothetical protein
MKTTKLLVFAGALDHASAGETFCPPHIRIGSSAAFFRVNIPPSEKDDDVSENGAAAAPQSALHNMLAATANGANRNRSDMTSPLLWLLQQKYHHCIRRKTAVVPQRGQWRG